MRLGRARRTTERHLQRLLTERSAAGLAFRARERCPGLGLIVDGEGSIRAQPRRADHSGTSWALILGESEVEKSSMLLQPLRQRAEQSECGWGEPANG